MAIIVSGSLVYDYIMNFPDSFRNHILPEQLHILSVCFVVDKLERSLGGTAGNIAYTIKMLGGEPTLVSALGKDGADYLTALREQAIGTAYVLQDATHMTASAHITTDSDDNQVTAFYNGPLGRATETTLGPAMGGIALISPTHKDVMIAHLNQAADAGLTVVFDPGQQLGAFSDIELTKLAGRSHFVIGNDYEIKLLTERTGLSAEKLAAAGTTLVTTLGARGSILTQPDGSIIEVAACPPQSVDDPTGAGDAYRAGFFVALEKKLSLTICGRVGSVAAAYAIEHYGTQAHEFTHADFAARYEATYHEKLPF